MSAPKRRHHINEHTASPWTYTRRVAAGGGPWEVTARLICTSCASHVDLPIGNKRLAQHLIFDKFQETGWSFRGRTASTHWCPSCSTRHSDKPEKGNGMAFVKTLPPKLEAVPAVAQSTSSVRAHRKLYSTLDDYFDENAGAYRADWSDEKVATETKLSLDVVVKVRREAYGEIKAAPAISKLLAEMKEIREIVDDFDKRLSTELERAR